MEGGGFRAFSCNTLKTRVFRTSLVLFPTCTADTFKWKESSRCFNTNDFVIDELFDQSDSGILGNSNKFANKPVSGLCTTQYLLDDLHFKIQTKLDSALWDTFFPFLG